MTTEQIEFSNLGKFHISQRLVLGYFILRFKSCDGFRQFFKSSDTEPLNARGTATSI